MGDLFRSRGPAPGPSICSYAQDVRPTEKSRSPMVRNIQEWRRMSGEQFSAALEQVGLGRAAFAWILGTRSERVTAWAKGAETVPFYMDVLLSLMTLPGAREMVLRVVRRQQIGDQQAEREFDAWESRDG